MYTHVTVEWDAHDRHAARSHVTHQGGEGESRGREHLVRVDDIHVGADEYPHDAEAEERDGQDGRPDANVRARRPAHPEERDGDADGWAEHGVPEADLRVELLSFTAGFGLLDLLQCHPVDDRYEQEGELEADKHRDEDDVAEALSDAVRVLEDVGPSNEKCEENDIDDGQVQRHSEDDRLREHEEWSRHADLEPTEQRRLDNLMLRPEPVIPSHTPQVLRLPTQKQRRVCLGHEEEHPADHQAREDQHGPLCPPPAHDRRRPNIRTHDRAKHRPPKRSNRIKRESPRLLDTIKHVRHAATRADKRRRRRAPRKEAEDDLRAKAGRQPGRHDPDHEDGHGPRVDGVAAERLGEGTRDQAAHAHADEVQACGERLGDLAYAEGLGCLWKDGGVYA